MYTMMMSLTNQNSHKTKAADNAVLNSSNRGCGWQEERGNTAGIGVLEGCMP
jgi:hypothetical protein